MTAYQLFRGLTGVDGELLAAAELVDSRKELAPKKLPARKIWLVAAVIALALLLAGCGIAYVFQKKWIMVTGTIGALGACVVFHGIYNILITANSRWNLIGYLFPIFLIFALLAVKKFRLYRKIEFE